MSTIIKRPDTDGDLLEWAPTPSRPHYLNIDDPVESPTVPTLTDYINAVLLNLEDRIHFEDIDGVLLITNIKVYFYAVAEDVAENSIQMQFVGPTWESSVMVGDLPTVAGWTYFELEDPNVIQSQFNSAYLRIIKNEGSTKYQRLYAVYAVLTYTAAGTAEPLPKTKKPMSGYNLFCSWYVKRKFLTLDPYRTPDGVLF